MINDPKINDPRRDPLDPRGPAVDPTLDPTYRDPRVVNNTTVHPGSSSRGGLAIAAVLAALLVIGFIAFTGSADVDPNPTAATGTTEEILPGTEPVAPSMDATGTQPARPPAAVPQENNPANPAGTGTAPTE